MPGFESFGGQYATSRKEPDAHVKPISLSMPTVIVETGWSESRAQLYRDRDLWLLGGRNAVNIVIILCWTNNSRHHVVGDIEVFDLDFQGNIHSLQHEVIEQKYGYFTRLS